MTIHPSTEMPHTDLAEFNTHSFVIKLWVEVTPIEPKQTSWRGHITHIPSGERRYVSNLFSIISFIAYYLKCMGIKKGRFWWIKDWFASQRQPASEYQSGEESFAKVSTHSSEMKG